MRFYFDSIEEYCSYFLDLVELERQAEREFHEREILQLSGREREKRGRALLNLSCHYLGEIFSGYYAYRFYRLNLGDHEINVGDVVLASRGGNPLKTGMEGVVYEKGKNFLTILFSHRISKLKGKWRVDLFVNDVTFKRMKNTLLNLESSLFPLEVILGKAESLVSEEEEVGGLDFVNESLDEFQREAVIRACRKKHLFLVHGPFGTGKTTTLVEIVMQHVKRGYKVLVTADSNTAVDGMVERLADRGVKVVRIGHPARMDRKLYSLSLDNLVRANVKWKEVERLIARRDLLRKRQEDYVRPVPAKRRGLSDEEIISLAEEGRKKRGHKIETIKSMAEWIKLKREIDDISARIRMMEEEVIREVLSGADVICTTNSGAGSDYLEGYSFDLVVIDEATQATEPSCLIPLVKSKKVILAGDHKQLPPTVLSQDERLSLTLFERLINIYPEASYMLRVQYRMNDVIKELPSRLFYNSEIISHPSVRDIKLSDLVGREGDSPITNDTPVVFVDTGGYFPESVKRASFSKHNPGEARIVKEIVDELIRFGVAREDIGVITPYKDQEDLLRSILPDKVEVKTVDGFQGREKEVIVISLVRSNPEEEIGFLKDARRLNVAITRAKRKLIIVGDKGTLSSSPLYSEVIEYFSTNGQIVNYSKLLDLQDKSTNF